MLYKSEKEEQRNVRLMILPSKFTMIGTHILICDQQTVLVSYQASTSS